MERLAILRQQFRWKIMVLRFVVNVFALLLTAILVPNIYFVDKQVLVLLFAAVMLGVLNAIVKPIIQFLTASLFFASYGLVVVAINALMLALLGWLFPRTLEVNGLLWALVGGAVIGLVSSFLENLLGINPPFLMLADQRSRRESGAPGYQGRHGLMGFLVSHASDKTASESTLQTIEVGDETIESRQDTGEPAPPAGI